MTSLKLHTCNDIVEVASFDAQPKERGVTRSHVTNSGATLFFPAPFFRMTNYINSKNRGPRVAFTFLHQLPADTLTNVGEAGSGREDLARSWPGVGSNWGIGSPRRVAYQAAALVVEIFSPSLPRPNQGITESMKE